MTADVSILSCPRCGTKNRVPKTRVAHGPRCGRCKSPLAPASYPTRPVEVTDLTFSDEVLLSSLPVLLDCWAPWCDPCRMIAPALENLAASYGGRLKIAKLNVDENPAAASRYGIRSIPTLLIFKGGRVTDTLVGALPMQEIERRILPHL